MNTEIFCVKCGEMTHPEKEHYLGHEMSVPLYDERGVIVGVEVDSCDYDFGYAFCPPPPEPSGDWQDALAEPGEEVIEPEVEVELNPALVGV